VIHEDGNPDGEGGAVLIEPFEVAPAEDEEFIAWWNAAREAFAGAQGYLGSRLHRSLDRADFRYVSIVRWSSPLMFARATKPATPFASHPALYQPVTPS
jgi:heme-degrading monooxygenase HmoA